MNSNYTFGGLSITVERLPQSPNAISNSHTALTLDSLLRLLAVSHKAGLASAVEAGLSIALEEINAALERRLLENLPQENPGAYETKLNRLLATQKKKTY